MPGWRAAARDSPAKLEAIGSSMALTLLVLRTRIAPMAEARFPKRKYERTLWAMRHEMHSWMDQYREAAPQQTGVNLNVSLKIDTFIKERPGEAE